MDFLSAGTKKSGRCREVAVSGGSTVKSKYPEEYWTVDKVGSEKLLARKPLLFRINRFLVSYVISKQARLNTF